MHVVQFVVNRCLFWCPFSHPRLTIYHSNLGVQIIAVVDLGASTFEKLTCSSGALQEDDLIVAVVNLPSVVKI